MNIEVRSAAVSRGAGKPTAVTTSVHFSSPHALVTVSRSAPAEKFIMIKQRQTLELKPCFQPRVPALSPCLQPLPLATFSFPRTCGGGTADGTFLWCAAGSLRLSQLVPLPSVVSETSFRDDSPSTTCSGLFKALSCT